MGLFDKAKNSLSERFGDETIRKGNFGAREEELENQEPAKTSRRKKKLPRDGQLNSTEIQEVESDLAENFEFDENQDTYDFPEEAPSALDGATLSKLSNDQGQSVGDILKSMKISETFTIGEDILFVDEELRNQSFNSQAPVGYDMGEVDFFVTRVQKTVAEYVRLLRLRNSDVETLAGKISDLSVDLNNFRFNAEVANGINIMATGGDEDSLAVELQETRSRLKRAEEELATYRNGGYNTEPDQNELAILHDEIAVERRGRQKAEAEAQDLRAHLVLIEEEYDIEIFSDRGEIDTPAGGGYESYAQQSAGQFQQSTETMRVEQELDAEEQNYQQVGRDHWLPNADDDESLPELEDEALPGFDDEPGYYADDQPYEQNYSQAGYQDKTAYDESLPDDGEDYSFEEIPLDSFDGNAPGGFDQEAESYEDSAFAPNPYQNLDEFIEDNLDGFPDGTGQQEPSEADDFEFPRSI